jgi:hypothetical protein
LPRIVAMSWLFGESQTAVESLIGDIEGSGHYGCLVEIKQLHKLCGHDPGLHGECGRRGMHALIMVLKTPGNGPETVSHALQILNNIMSVGPGDDVTTADTVGRENSRSFLTCNRGKALVETNDSIGVLSVCLADSDVRVRLAACRLLATLLTNQPAAVHAGLLQSSGAP